MPDGDELVAVASSGRPDCDALGRRMNGGGNDAVCLMLLDIMHVDGESTMTLAVEERKRRLGAPAGRADWRTVSYSVDRGGELLAASRAEGLERLRRQAPPLTLRPRSAHTGHWIKITKFRDEPSRWSAAGSPTAPAAWAALLLGTMNREVLDYRGLVELGIGRRLLPRARAPRATPKSVSRLFADNRGQRGSLCLVRINGAARARRAAPADGRCGTWRAAPARSPLQRRRSGTRTRSH